MLLSQLLPAICALHFGGGHADLHPANANFFLEVPDIEAAISAYEAAPLAKLLRDEQVRTFIASLVDLDPEEVSFSTLSELGLSEMRESLPLVGVQSLELLPEVRHASFSISGVELEGLTQEVLAAEGSWSTSLRERVGRVRVRAVLDFESADSVQRAVDLICSQVEGEDATLSGFSRIETQLEFVGQKLDCTYYRGAEAGISMGFWIVHHDARLILGSGLDPAPESLTLVREPLSSLEAFATSSRQMRGTDGVTVLESYVSLGGLRELPRLLDLVPGMPQEFKSMAGLALEVLHAGGAVQTRSRTSLVESRFVTESFEREYGSSQAPRLHVEEAITRDSFRMVPRDAVGVWAVHLDKQGINEFLVSALADVTGSDPEKVMATLEEEYGFRPDRDLVGALGGRFVFYTLPFTGIGMPKLYVAVDLEDDEAFARGLQGLGEYLVAVSDGAVEFNSKPYRKRPFMSFTPGKDLEELTSGMNTGGMMSWAPAFLSISAACGVLEDRAILSLSNMYTKREMKRLMGEEGDGQYSILEDSSELPVGIESYGRTDWGMILGGLYDSLRGFLPLIEQGLGGEMPFEIEDMPRGSVFAEYFQPTVSWRRRTAGGVYEYKKSSFGPEVPGALCALVLAAIGTSGDTVRVESQLEPVPQAGFEHEAGSEASRESQTIGRLRDLKLRIVVYKGEVGRYPAALSNLMDSTPNFPNGFLDGGEQPSDAWGGSFEYSSGNDGASYRLWSKGPNGLDEGGGGDDLALPRKGD
jgi:hypothetical protein